MDPEHNCDMALLLEDAKHQVHAKILQNHDYTPPEQRGDQNFVRALSDSN
jgi:hypothetical protein